MICCKRKTTCTKVLALGMFALGISAPAHGQCCQNTSPTPTAEIPAPAGAGSVPTCCSQKQNTADPTNSKSGSLTSLHRPESVWLLNAIERIAAEISRIVDELTFADYSTQWSSWCSGNLGGASKPRSTRCCKKPCDDQKPTTTEKSKCSG